MESLKRIWRCPGFHQMVNQSNGWAEDLYFRAKNSNKEASEIIYPNCEYPRLAYAINGIIHNIGFKSDMELQAAMAGVKLR